MYPFLFHDSPVNNYIPDQFVLKKQNLEIRFRVSGQKVCDLSKWDLGYPSFSS